VETYRVRFLAPAREDLFELYGYIRNQSGARSAGGYVDRIETACLSLTTAAERGTRRDDLLPGIRTLASKAGPRSSSECAATRPRSFAFSTAARTSNGV
jgi:plasmid stabilization system protein ParE